MFILKEYYLINDIVECKELIKTEDIDKVEELKERLVLECELNSIEAYEIIATKNIQSLREILKRNVRIFRVVNIQNDTNR